MPKYHVNNEGVPGVCDAKIKCRFGLSEEQHYSSEEEARTAYEAKNKGNEVPVLSKKENTQQGEDAASYSSMGVRELGALAKTATDEKVLLEAASRGNKNLTKIVASNRNSTPEVLRAAYLSTEDKEAKAALTRHSKYPVKDLSTEEFMVNLKGIPAVTQDSYLTDESLDDERFTAVRNAIKDKSLYMAEGTLYSKALSNPRNNLSPETRAKIATYNSVTFTAYAKNNPEASIRPLLDKDSKTAGMAQDIFQGSENKRHLLEGAQWAVDNGEDEDYYKKSEARIAMHNLARNPNTPNEALSALSKNIGTEDRDLHTLLNDHPNADGYIKRKANAMSSKVFNRNQLKFKLGGEDKFDEARKTLTLEEKSVNTGRGYRSTTRKIDVEKAKAMNLTANEVKELFFSTGAYNAQASYNEETGEMVTATDSGD